MKITARKTLNNNMFWHDTLKFEPYSSTVKPPLVSLKENELLFIEERKRHSDFPLHVHTFVELFIVTHGNAIHLINNEEHFIAVGDFIVIPPNTPHGFKNTCQFDIINVSFNYDHWAQEDSTLHELIDDVWRLYRYNRNIISLSWQSLEMIKSIIEVLITNSNSERKSKYLTKMNYLLLAQIMTLIADNATTQNRHTQHDLQEFCLSLISEIRQQSNDVNISNRVKKQGINYQNFLKKFKELTGISPAKIKNTILMNKALNLLVKNNLTVNEVALKLNYNDQAYFSKLFKAHYGFSPKKTQKMINI